MYKLVCTGGKLRGEEFILKEGSNHFGRSSSADHTISQQGVSKKHMNILVQGDLLTIEDLGSANGTMVNGVLTKKKPLKDGDQIAVPDLIFQVVYVKENRVYVKKFVGENSQADNNMGFGKESMPEDPLGKIRWIFKNNIMAPLYKINEEYEWAVMVAIFLSIFTAINIAISIVPVLSDNKKVLFQEVGKRASNYADEIARMNAVALIEKDLDRIDTNFLDSVEGIESYELFDPDGRIVRPVTKINEYTTDSFSIEARDFHRSKGNAIRRPVALNDNQIGVSKSIMAYNPNNGNYELVGIIAIRFKPSSWARVAAANSISYFRALAISILLAAFIFGFIYYLTSRPIDELTNQLEDYMGGKETKLESNLLFPQISSLKENIKNLIQRLDEAESDGGFSTFGEGDDEGPYLERLIEILEVCPGPGMVLTSEKNIHRINLEAEDLTGIRETAAEGENIVDVAREKGFGATVISICDQCANDDGKAQTDEYELGGISYKINAVGLIGKDEFCKGFLITFVNED